MRRALDAATVLLGQAALPHPPLPDRGRGHVQDLGPAAAQAHHQRPQQRAEHRGPYAHLSSPGGCSGFQRNSFFSSRIFSHFSSMSAAVSMNSTSSLLVQRVPAAV